MLRFLIFFKASLKLKRLFFPVSHLAEQVLLEVMVLDESPPPELPDLVVQSVLLAPHESLGLLGVHLLEVFFMLK